MLHVTLGMHWPNICIPKVQTCVATATYARIQPESDVDSHFNDDCLCNQVRIGRMSASKTLQTCLLAFASEFIMALQLAVCDAH